ncbi:hypothetical protein [Sulfurimonas sp.]|uniref:hypothetical protein n=1 Tax=Sulfurimonas sp. TaxID=2022749 RepID=UPI003568478B
MKKLLLIVALIISSQSLYAYNSKGMKVYKKVCISCHGSPFRGAKMHTIYEWEGIFDESKTPFKTLHKDEPDALKELDTGYLTKKRVKSLQKFLIGNAKDAGAVPGCDGNYCGGY